MRDCSGNDGVWPKRGTNEATHRHWNGKPDPEGHAQKISLKVYEFQLVELALLNSYFVI